MNTSKNNIIIKNKKASRNYHLTDKYQAGIVLEGWEVKGLRNGKVDIKDSYVMLKNNEAWVIGLKVFLSVLNLHYHSLEMEEGQFLDL